MTHHEDPAPKAPPLQPGVKPAETIAAHDLIWCVDVPKCSEQLTYGDVHEIVHRDIAIGNDYRKERIKLLTALSTGVFALTVTFHKDLFDGKLDWYGWYLMLGGWTALLISLLSGIFHFRNWEDFYLGHRAVGLALWKFRTRTGGDQQEAVTEFTHARAEIKRLQKAYKAWNFFQTSMLLLGMALIAAYVGYSGFVKLRHEEMQAPARSHPAATEIPAASAAQEGKR
jgi:hypothetical protein